MFVNLSLEPQQPISRWLFQIISFEDIYIGSQIWYYWSLRNISWFYCSLDDENLTISEYNLALSDHASNTKHRGVCLNYKSYLPLRLLNISHLKECLNLELKIGDKSCNSVALYRSTSQYQDDFETLSDKFETTLETLPQKGSLRQLLVALTPNPVTGIVMITRVS